MALMKLRNLNRLTLLVLLSFVGCTPVIPDYYTVREKNACLDKHAIDENVSISDRPMELHDIVQVALSRNLDIQLQEIEQQVYNENYVAEKLRQLPSNVLSGEYSKRDNVSAWYSKPLGGTIGALPSISSEKEVRRTDLTMTFNTLNFSLTYVKTRQEKNKATQLQQRHLRARQNLILDVYRAYYRAVIAKKAKDQASALIGTLEERQKVLKRQVEQQLVSEMRGLINENRIIDMKVRLSAFENEYRSAMTELAGLMGLAPGIAFEVADIPLKAIDSREFNVRRLEDVALYSRPELYAQDIQHMIDSDSVRSNLLRMFPGFDLFSGWFYWDDSFQYHNTWLNVGAKMVWDLFMLPSKWQDVRSSTFQRNLAWNTRLSLSMGILTQVHLAHINVQETLLQKHLSEDLYRVKNRQYEVASNMEKRGEFDIDNVIAHQVEALFAEVNALKGFANYQVALEQLGNSVGQPLLFHRDPRIQNLREGFGYGNPCDLSDLDQPGIIQFPQMYHPIVPNEIDQRDTEEDDLEHKIDLDDEMDGMLKFDENWSEDNPWIYFEEDEAGVQN